MPHSNKTIADFLSGKSKHTLELFDHFVEVSNEHRHSHVVEQIELRLLVMSETRGRGEVPTKLL